MSDADIGGLVANPDLDHVLQIRQHAYAVRGQARFSRRAAASTRSGILKPSVYVP